MADFSKRMGPRTKIWRNGPSGPVLAEDIEGLPYGKRPNIQIAGLGEATLTGVQTSGSGNQEIIIEVSYILK